ncbi:MAG: hypothetical protein ACREU6_13450 [Steroidobacteraceae bacterium]
MRGSLVAQALIKKGERALAAKVFVRTVEREFGLASRPAGARGLATFRERYPETKVWFVGEAGMKLGEFFSHAARDWFS